MVTVSLLFVVAVDFFLELRTGRVHVQLDDCLKALRPRNLKVMRSLHDVNEMMDRVLQVFEGFFSQLEQRTYEGFVGCVADVFVIYSIGTIPRCRQQLGSKIWGFKSQHSKKCDNPSCLSLHVSSVQVTVMEYWM